MDDSRLGVAKRRYRHGSRCIARRTWRKGSCTMVEGAIYFTFVYSNQSCIAIISACTNVLTILAAPITSSTLLKIADLRRISKASEVSDQKFIPFVSEEYPYSPRRCGADSDT